MRVSFDGKTWQEVDQVTVVQTVPNPTEKGEDPELIFKFTSKTLDTEVLFGNIFIGHESQTYTEIGDRVVL